MKLKNTPWILHRVSDTKTYNVLDSKEYFIAEYLDEPTAKAIASLPETLAELEAAKDRIKRLEGVIDHQQYRWHNKPFKIPNAADLKAMRKNRWMSMGQVQDACGVSKSTISRIEKGKAADYSNIKKLVDFYQSKTIFNGDSKCPYCKSTEPCEGVYPEGCFHKILKQVLVK